MKKRVFQSPEKKLVTLVVFVPVLSWQNMMRQFLVHLPRDDVIIPPLPLDPPPDVWPTFTWWLQVSPKPENTKKNHQNHVGIISINFGCIIIGWSPVQCRLRIFIQILQNKKFPMILFRSTGDDQRASYFFVQILSYLTPSNIRLLHELYLWYNSPFLFSKYLQNLINLYTHQCLSLLMKTFSRIPIKTNGSMFYL